MGAILSQLAAGATRDVGVQIGATTWWWRVRRVVSADLAQQGLGMLLSVATPQALGEAVSGLRRGELSAEEAVTRLLTSADSARMERQTAQYARQKRAMVCAGLVAVGQGETAEAATWEPLRLVDDPAKRDPEAGRLTVEDLPGGVYDILYDAIVDLTTDGGAAAQRLATFRSEPRDAAPVPPAGEDLRGTPE